MVIPLPSMQGQKTLAISSKTQHEIKTRLTFDTGVSRLSGYGGEHNRLDTGLLFSDNTTTINASHDLYINPAQTVVSLPWDRCCLLQDIKSSRGTLFLYREECLCDVMPCRPLVSSAAVNTIIPLSEEHAITTICLQLLRQYIDST